MPSVLQMRRGQGERPAQGLQDVVGRALTNEQASLVLPSNEGPKCVDLASGTALGSKTAELLVYEAGTCEPSGGEVIGEPLTEVPVTFCCIPELIPPP